MDKLKLKSYALLMTYDLPNVIKQNTKHLKEYLKNDLDPINEQILLAINKIGKNPIDIYTWTPDWDELYNHLNIVLKLVKKTQLLYPDMLLVLLNNWNIEPGNIDLKTLSNRMGYIITKYINLKWLFYIIYNNYKDFIKYHSDIEIGSEKFHEIVLKRINNTRPTLTSERMHTEFITYFDYAKKNKTSTYELIINNLPFDFLAEISTSNENKISLLFQRGLAREMLFYFDFTRISTTQKQYFLGFSFSLCEFIYNEDEFIQKKLAKDKYYEFERSDYDEFLRTEGYNVFKSL